MVHQKPYETVYNKCLEKSPPVNPRQKVKETNQEEKGSKEKKIFLSDAIIKYTLSSLLYKQDSLLHYN